MDRPGGGMWMGGGAVPSLVDVGPDKSRGPTVTAPLTRVRKREGFGFRAEAWLRTGRTQAAGGGCALSPRDPSGRDDGMGPGIQPPEGTPMLSDAPGITS